MFPKGATCTPTSENSGWLKDPVFRQSAVVPIALRVVPVLSRPFPRNIRMRNVQRRNLVRPTGFLAMRVIALLGRFHCLPSRRQLDGLNPGDSTDHHEPLKPKKCLVPTPCPISRSSSKIRPFLGHAMLEFSFRADTDRANQISRIWCSERNNIPARAWQKRSFTSHTEYDPGDSAGPFMLEP